RAPRPRACAPDRARPGSPRGRTGRAARPGLLPGLHSGRRPAALERQLEYPPHERVEVDARGLGRLRQQARLGEPRYGVGLKHLQLAGRVLEHQVDPPEAVEPEQLVDADRERPRAPREALVALRGATELDAPD